MARQIEGPGEASLAIEDRDPVEPDVEGRQGVTSVPVHAGQELKEPGSFALPACRCEKGTLFVEETELRGTGIRHHDPTVRQDSRSYDPEELVGCVPLSVSNSERRLILDPPATVRGPEWSLIRNDPDPGTVGHRRARGTRSVGITANGDQGPERQTEKPPQSPLQRGVWIISGHGYLPNNLTVRHVGTVADKMRVGGRNPLEHNDV